MRKMGNPVLLFPFQRLPNADAQSSGRGERMRIPTIPLSCSEIAAAVFLTEKEEGMVLYACKFAICWRASCECGRILWDHVSYTHLDTHPHPRNSLRLGGDEGVIYPSKHGILRKIRAFSYQKFSPKNFHLLLNTCMKH